MNRPQIVAVSLQDLVSICEQTVDAVDGGLHALLWLHPDTPDEIIVATDSIAPELLQVERALGQGPTITAVAGGRIERTHARHDDLAWADYIAHSVAHGVHSSAAFPIKHGNELVGVLMLGSVDYYGFTTQELRTGRQAASRIAAALMPLKR